MLLCVIMSTLSIVAFISKISEHQESAINSAYYVKVLHIGHIVFINP